MESGPKTVSQWAPLGLGLARVHFPVTEFKPRIDTFGNWQNLWTTEWGILWQKLLIRNPYSSYWENYRNWCHHQGFEKKRVVNPIISLFNSFVQLVQQVTGCYTMTVHYCKLSKKTTTKWLLAQFNLTLPLAQFFEYSQVRSFLDVLLLTWDWIPALTCGVPCRLHLQRVPPRGFSSSVLLSSSQHTLPPVPGLPWSQVLICDPNVSIS